MGKRREDAITFKQLEAPVAKYLASSWDEYERQVVGAMLQQEEAYLEATEILDMVPDPFYNERLQYLYNVIKVLYSKEIGVDIVSVSSYINDDGKLDFIGGTYYLTDLLRDAITTANTKYYAQRMLEGWKYRKTTRLLKRKLEELAKWEGSLDGVYFGAWQLELEKIANIEGHEYDDTPKRAATATFEYIKSLRNNEIETLRSVFSHYNILTGGYQEGDYIVLAARPSIGKTAYALTELRYQAYERNIPVAFFSLDSKERNIMYRIFSQETGIPVKNLRLGWLNNDELELLEKAKERHSRYKFIIDDRPLSIEQIYSRVRRLTMRYGIKFLVVDFVQLIRTSGKQQTRDREVGEISGILKQVAKEFGLVVIALSQLNRAAELRPDKKPMLADLRESGTLEQDADIVILPYRPEFYGIEQFDLESKTMLSAGKAEIIIAKGRDVGTGFFMLEFEKQTAHFKNDDGSPILDNSTTTIEENNEDEEDDEGDAPF